jgi:hypothetical protein
VTGKLNSFNSAGAFELANQKQTICIRYLILMT